MHLSLMLLNLIAFFAAADALILASLIPRRASTPTLTQVYFFLVLAPDWQAFRGCLFSNAVPQSSLFSFCFLFWFSVPADGEYVLLCLVTLAPNPLFTFSNDAHFEREWLLMCFALMSFDSFLWKIMNCFSWHWEFNLFHGSYNRIQKSLYHFVMTCICK